MKKSIFLIFISCLLAFSPAYAQKGKLRISILGDSYSTYEGYLTPDTNEVWYFRPENAALHTKNNVRQVEQTWWHQVIEKMGAKLEINNSYSGATVCYTGYKHGKPQHDDYHDRAFITRSNKLGNPNLILICGGTNDSWCGAPVGDYIFGNWTDAQLYNYRPALAKLLYDLRANYPTAELLFILNSDLKPSINESTHTICNHYNVPCLDLQDIDKQQGHPSIKGMKSFAEQVIAYLQNKL